MRKEKEIVKELDYINRVIDQYLTFIENSKNSDEERVYQNNIDVLLDRKDALEWVLE